MEDFLTPEELLDLRLRHRKEKDGRTRDRIKAVLLLHKGWSYKQISEALFLDEETISNHVSEYREERKLRIVTGGITHSNRGSEASSFKSYVRKIFRSL